MIFIDATVQIHAALIREMPFADFQNRITITGSAPERPRPRMIDALPENVRSSFTEAEMNFSDGRYPSAAVGYRKALERSLKAVHPETSGRLVDRIKGLSKENAIPKTLTDMMDGIRFLGNDAAHDDEDPTIEEVSTARDFTSILLTYMFELPARITEAQARRAAAKG